MEHWHSQVSKLILEYPGHEAGGLNELFGVVSRVVCTAIVLLKAIFVVELLADIVVLKDDEDTCIVAFEIVAKFKFAAADFVLESVDVVSKYAADVLELDERLGADVFKNVDVVVVVLDVNSVIEDGEFPSSAEVKKIVSTFAFEFDSFSSEVSWANTKHLFLVKNLPQSTQKLSKECQFLKPSYLILMKKNVFPSLK